MFRKLLRPAACAAAALTNIVGLAAIVFNLVPGLYAETVFWAVACLGLVTLGLGVAAFAFDDATPAASGPPHEPVHPAT